MTKNTKKNKRKTTTSSNSNSFRYKKNKDEISRETIDESVLDIDKNDLDKEFCRQPRLYIKYAAELANARMLLDESDNSLKAIKATLDGLIRSDPSAYDLPDKITETVIASAILLQDSYMKAQKKVSLAQYKVNLLFAMIGAFDHKKSALENLVKLQGQSYYATPRSDSEGKDRLMKERSDKVARKCRKDKQK